LEKLSPFEPQLPQPQNLESALNLVFNVCLHSAREIEASQNLPFFNVFLAPFAKDAEPARVKDLLRLFVRNVSQQVDVSFGLELTVPDFLAKKATIGLNGNRVGSYGDFVEQAQVLSSLLFEVFMEENERKPFLRPTLIVNIRSESFVDEKAKALLVKSLSVATDTGAVYYANLIQKSRRHSVFFSSGLKLAVDADGDWETDTMRTGCLGTVGVNVPRVVYESGKDRIKVVEALKEQIEMSGRALDIKYRALKSRGKRLLPFIKQGNDGDHYFRLDNCSRVVNLVGLEEAVLIFSEKGVADEKTLGFLGDVVDGVSGYVRKMGRRRGRGVSLAVVPSFECSQRLVQVDVEKYGIARVKFSGTRERPFYKTFAEFTLNGESIPVEYQAFEGKLTGVHDGGGLTAVDLGEGKHESSELLSLTSLLVQSNVEFWVFDRKQSYCVSCRKSWFGSLKKCPFCGGVGTLVVFDRLACT
jgi:ribonucleoside-triphosphate reductase